MKIGMDGCKLFLETVGRFSIDSLQVTDPEYRKKVNQMCLVWNKILKDLRFIDTKEEIHKVVGQILEHLVKAILEKKCGSNSFEDEDEELEGFQASEITDEQEFKDMIATVLKKHEKGSLRFLFDALSGVFQLYQQNLGNANRQLVEKKLAYLIDIVNETLILGFPSIKKVQSYPPLSEEQERLNGNSQQCFDFQICAIVLFIFRITN